MVPLSLRVINIIEHLTKDRVIPLSLSVINITFLSMIGSLTLVIKSY